MAEKNGKNPEKNIARISRHKRSMVSKTTKKKSARFPISLKHRGCEPSAMREGCARANPEQVSPELCEGKISLKKKISGKRREIFGYNVALFGFMCSGKTSAGKKLARLLGFGFADTDILFEKEYGKIAAFVKKRGFKEFRKLERKLLKEALESKRLVIACGGGLFPGSARGKCARVFLDVPWRVLEKRLVKNAEGRPLLKDFPAKAGEIEALYAKRRKKYLKADAVVKLSGGTPAGNAEKIRKILLCGLRP